MGYIADHASESGKLRWRLVEIYFTSSVVARMTDATFRITWNGHDWLPQPLTVSQITNPVTGATCSLDVADADQYLFGFLSTYNGGIQCPVNIYTTEFAPGFTTNVPADVVQTFAGMIQSVTKNTAGTTDSVNIACGPPVLTTTINLPVRLITSFLRSSS